ncbi:MAG: HDOD domain-containing protein [Bryobacteraceae bacterium]|jgi:putative nucleotidyltransferase with HDIG domain
MRQKRLEVYSIPQTGPLAGHLRRVSTLAREIAARLRLRPTDSDTLTEAALLHHYPAEVLQTKAFHRLLADLRMGFPYGAASAFPPRRVRDVLERFHEGRSANAAYLLAQIVEVANFFDERLEFFPFEPMNFEQIIDELDWIAKEGFLNPAVVAALAGLPQVRMHELLEQVHRLPIFPAVLLEALRITADEDSSFSQIERIVRSDQVLAGHLLRVANSPLYSPLRRIASIPQAISYVGLDTCRKVMMASVFQPLFSSAVLRDLWRHSLAMARLAERLAQLCGRIDPQEAFLAGLVHDIGRLALQKLRHEDVMNYQRLIEGGCEPVFAEMLLCGFEHGAIGAEVLRCWTFPEHLIEAVLHHHHPELGDSLLAAALYLAECMSGSREDIASPVRLGLAHDRLGIASEVPEGEGSPDPGWLDVLISAA